MNSKSSFRLIKTTYLLLSRSTSGQYKKSPYTHTLKVCVTCEPQNQRLNIFLDLLSANFLICTIFLLFFSCGMFPSWRRIFFFTNSVSSDEIIWWHTTAPMWQQQQQQQLFHYFVLIYELWFKWFLIWVDETGFIPRFVMRFFLFGAIFVLIIKAQLINDSFKCSVAHSCYFYNRLLRSLFQRRLNWTTKATHYISPLNRKPMFER